MRRFIILTFLAAASCAWAHGPGKTNDFSGRHVLFIGIDGCRADAMRDAMERGLAPNLKALSASGLFTLQEYAGGEKDTVTEQPTVSGPGWATLFTGVWHNKHKVINNAFKNNALAQFPHFMRRLKEVQPTAWCASLTSWPPVNERIVADSRTGERSFVDTLFTAEYPKAERDLTPDKDIEVRDAAIETLRTHDPDVMCLHFGQVDEYGHGSIDPRASFSPDSVLYMHGIAMLDSHIGEVLRAMHRRPRFAEENWMVLVTTDHGGRGNGHGGQSDEERNIWLMAAGQDLPTSDLLTKPFGQTVVPRLIFRHLGVPVNPDWNWEPDPFVSAK